METDIQTLLHELPAKSEPFQSIITHGIVTGIIAQELSRDFLAKGTRAKIMSAMNLTEDQWNAFIGYFAGLHDIGKIAPRFMTRIARRMPNNDSLLSRLADAGLGWSGMANTRPPHETTSNIVMKRIWTARGSDLRSASLLASILGSHHQGHPNSDQERESSQRLIAYHDTYERVIAETFDWQADTIPQIAREYHPFIGAVLCGLVILADWIASGEMFAEAEKLSRQNNFLEILREQSRQFLKVSGLTQVPFATGSSLEEMWPQFHGHFRPLQRETERLFSEKPNIRCLLVEAPMGEGKTEIALFAASQMLRQWNKTGMYVAMPTAATANQMAGRVRSFFKRHAANETVRLLHATAWLVDESSTAAMGSNLSNDDNNGSRTEVEIASSWLRPLRRGLLSSNAVGTVDQAMMAAMFIKYGALRLLGLTGKVLIIDEVHAYDVYMSNIVERLLEWCKMLEIPVVLLSATLTQKKRATLLKACGAQEAPAVSYASISAVISDGECIARHVESIPRPLVKVEVHETLHDVERTADMLVKAASAGGTVGIILNTVGEAQQLYEAVLQRNWQGKLHLFHGRFTAEDRKRIEKECVDAFGPDPNQRLSSGILISTQVAEQSLDIDLDILFTAIAPMDLVLQRLGRMFRHSDTIRPAHISGPVLHVLVPPKGAGYGASAGVYPECLLQRSDALVRMHHQIKLPDDIQQLVEAGYDEQNIPEEEFETWMEHLLEESLQQAETIGRLLDAPENGFRPLKESARLDDLESGGYLSAKTRLGPPAVRVALMEKAFFNAVRPMAGKDGTLRVTDPDIAQGIMARSVSIPAAWMQDLKPDFKGAGLIHDVDLYLFDETRGAAEGRLSYSSTLGVRREGGNNG